MFSSNILDVAVGLVFVFLLLSLISSAANELIESAVKKRAVFLHRGIIELIGGTDSDEGKKLLTAIYDHGLVNALYKGTYASASKDGDLPSYIPAQNFALALLDLRHSGQALPPNVQKALGAFEKVAAGKADVLRQEVEDWYNSSMDRVSGWYKRRSQRIVLALGVLITIGINADTVQIAKRLSTDASLRQAAAQIAEATAAKMQKPVQSAPADLTSQAPPSPSVTPATPTAGAVQADPANAGPAPDSAAAAMKQVKVNLATLDGIGLPLGWQGRRPWQKEWWMLVPGHLMGWLITALAVSLGAPFWFDVLNKFIVVRSTVKPSEKSGAEASKDPTLPPAVLNLLAPQPQAPPPAPPPAAPPAVP
jgi:hypothetical protein